MIHFKEFVDQYNEGTWHLPSDKKVAMKFKKLMSKPITLGKNGGDAIDSIEPFIGDDSLYDDLGDAGKKNPKGDARKIITKHMKVLNINPKTFHWAGQESIDEVSPAQRRARKQAYLIKTMKKYGDAAKMGIDAKDVNQRRNTPTRKKS